MPGRRPGRALQVPHPLARHAATGVDKADPSRLRRDAAADRLDRLGPRATTGATASGWRAPRAQQPRTAPMSDLRGAPRLVDARPGGRQPLAHLPRDRPQARRLRRELGFTHVELLPVMEHPFYGSWGYQTTGYFAPTSRYGTPQDFMYLVDHLHQRGIGVILDWVPSHFPDRRARAAATSTARTSTSTPTRAGASTRTGTASIFNYGRHEVRSFLLEQRLFWLDGITSTACASTPSPRCSTSTTRASRASGSRTSSAAARTSRPSTSCAASTIEVYSELPGRADDRRGVDRLADGVAPDLRRRARLRHEVGHGLDARHARSTWPQDPSTASSTTTS